MLFIFVLFMILNIYLIYRGFSLLTEQSELALIHIFVGIFGLIVNVLASVQHIIMGA